MKQIKSFRITEANQKRLTKLAKLDGRSESYIIDNQDFIYYPFHVTYSTKRFYRIHDVRVLKPKGKVNILNTFETRDEASRWIALQIIQNVE